MALVSIDRNPTDRTLLQFGCITAVVLPVAAEWFGCPLGVVTAAAVSGSALLLTAIVEPKLMRLPFLAMCYATAPIGIVVGEALTAALYFAVMWPIASIMKLVGRDPLQRRIEPERATYWTRKPTTGPAGRYLRQY